MNASKVNQDYIDLMNNATEKKGAVLYRVKQLWWPQFLAAYKLNSKTTINQLDFHMNRSRNDLQKMAEDYAADKIGNRNSEKYRQSASQFLKSNTGKMFEQFMGLCMAHYLLDHDSEYAVWPFRKDLEKKTTHLKKEHFRIDCQLGNSVYSTDVDADLIVFNPADAHANFYMVSVKSTLKDRFHNVPFWNLLRICATNQMHSLSAANNQTLARANYVAVCTDLADEQPDFAGQDGPRNLLCLDASLLDGAYVSSARAQGLGADDNHFGAQRGAAFYPLDKFLSMLC